MSIKGMMDIQLNIPEYKYLADAEKNINRLGLILYCQNSS